MKKRIEIIDFHEDYLREDFEKDIPLYDSLLVFFDKIDQVDLQDNIIFLVENPNLNRDQCLEQIKILFEIQMKSGNAKLKLGNVLKMVYALRKIKLGK